MATATWKLSSRPLSSLYYPACPLETKESKPPDYNTFEDWHLAANKDQDEYMKMYGMVNFSIIKLANTYYDLAMRGIGKYGQFLALHRLTWPQTLPEILLNAEVPCPGLH
jgi:hypothetical protein